MGSNAVNCERDSNKDFVIFWIKGYAGGTRRWQRVADELVDTVRDVSEQQAWPFECLTPTLTTGRGARYRARRIALALVLARLEVDFAREVSVGELVFNLGPIPQLWLERARLVVQRQRLAEAGKTSDEDSPDPGWEAADHGHERAALSIGDPSSSIPDEVSPRSPGLSARGDEK